MTTVNLTSANFDYVIDSNEIVFIDFWAPTCAPCLSFAPIYDQIATQHPDVVFAKMNINEEQQFAQDFQIRSIPLLMAFKQKVIIFSQAGLLPANALDDLVQQAKSLDMAPVFEEMKNREQDKQ